MTKQEKNEVIEVLKGKFSQYSNFYITDTESLTVAQVTTLLEAIKKMLMVRYIFCWAFIRVFTNKFIFFLKKTVAEFLHNPHLCVCAAALHRLS